MIGEAISLLRVPSRNVCQSESGQLAVLATAQHTVAKGSHIAAHRAVQAVGTPSAQPPVGQHSRLIGSASPASASPHGMRITQDPSSIVAAGEKLSARGSVQPGYRQDRSSAVAAQGNAGHRSAGASKRWRSGWHPELEPWRRTHSARNIVRTQTHAGTQRQTERQTERQVQTGEDTHRQTHKNAHGHTGCRRVKILGGRVGAAAPVMAFGGAAALERCGALKRLAACKVRSSWMGDGRHL